MLQIAKKTFQGKLIGYVVGYWFYPRRYYGSRNDRQSFRSFRNGVIFKTEKLARAFRDDVEARRPKDFVQWDAVKDE